MFVISCLFKKTCSWKKCPFRETTLNRQTDIIGTPAVTCRKCPYPYDEQEENELKEKISEIQKLIDSL